MANPEKHKKNPLAEWLDDEQPSVSAKPRGGSGKLPRPASRRFHAEADQGSKVEPALVREPSQPLKVEEKQSQAKSREHLLKQQRLGSLRAPHSTKPGRAAGAGH